MLEDIGVVSRVRDALGVSCCVSNQETVGSHVEFTYKFILRLQSNKKR